MASIINASTAGVGGVITTADNSGILNIQTAGTTAITVNASQNVGVGTASPAQRLHVLGGASPMIIAGTNAVTAYSEFRYNTSTTSGYIGNGAGLIGTATATDFIIRSENALILSSNAGAAAMKLDASGNLLVGTTSGSERVTAAGTNANWMYSSNSTGSGTFYHFIFKSNGTQTGTITSTSTTATYGTSSDYRLKENIAPMTGALDKVALLKPVTYNWKLDGSDGQGFIAHELAEVCPDAVQGEKDATCEEEYEISPAIPAVIDEEGVEVAPAVEAVMGTRTVPVYQGIDTSFLVATLVAAIQELKAEIDLLKGAK